MTSRLNPYITFDGDARQAMDFYRSVFGGEVERMTFAEMGMADSPDAQKVMHSMLVTPSGFTLMAADCPQGMSYDPGDNITVSLSGDDAEELHGYWAKLSEGGTVGVPMEKQMWGDEFGACVDKFGINWMVDIGEPQS
ncbi:VOC family protein [Streptomyces sp. HNM0574]|uniref:VOC family protein n=1 Tax=Streptomyces sp. HNM0574 TaxID=2714954 RepID=UPI00146E91D2|nr:VOC family protein [Streptomyces sp. HNM0574]NLU68128.1 VOC family protein [Streptomyces sp. HNM0574]